jgi:hypothetical protein
MLAAGMRGDLVAMSEHRPAGEWEEGGARRVCELGMLAAGIRGDLVAMSTGGAPAVHSLEH